MKYLRQWKIEDAKDLAQAINNQEVQDKLRDGLPFPYTADDAAEYIRSALEAPLDTQYAWAI